MKIAIASVQKRTISYLPSVSFLIHKHSITLDQLSGIQGTGPKNRILKGDILGFLKGGLESFVESVESESFNSIELNLSKLKTALAGTSLSIQDALAAAVFSQLQAKNSLTLKSSIAYLTREAFVGNFNAKLDTTKEISAKKVSKLNESSAPISRGSLRLIDSIGLGYRYETPTWHLSNGEAAIVSLSPAIEEINQDEDILDILTTNTNTSAFVQPSVNQDIYDFKNVDCEMAQLELTSDSRIISQDSARLYLEAIKDVVENQPESLLQQRP